MSRYSLTLLAAGVTLALAGPAAAQDPVGALLGAEARTTTTASDPNGDALIDDLNRGVLQADAAVVASNEQAMADWRASVEATEAETARLRAEWEASIRAQETADAESRVAWDAENARREAEWRARVAACEAGDRMACQPD